MALFVTALRLVVRCLPQDLRARDGRAIVDDSLDWVRAERRRAGVIAAGWLATRILLNLTAIAVREAVAGPLAAVSREYRGSWRRMRRSWLASAATIGMCTLAIGSAVAVGGILSAAFLDDGGADAPERIVSLQVNRDPVSLSFEYPEYERLRASGLFERLSASAYTSLTCSCSPEGRPVPAAVVSAGFFEVFGVAPFLGRFLREGEAEAVVLSHATWVTAFDRADTAIGRQVTIRERPYMVVGVLPASFPGPFVGVEPAVWLPMGAQPHVLLPAKFLRAVFPDLRRAKGYSWVHVWGRLPAGTAPDGLTAALAALRPNDARADRIAAVPLRDARVPPQLRSTVRQLFGALSVAVLLVLLLAGSALAQVGALRAEHTLPEMAVKLSLGAPLAAIVALPVMDVAVMAATGGALGLVSAPFLLEMFLLTLPPTTVPITISIAVVNGWTVAAAGVLLLLLTIVPAAATCFRLYRRRDALTVRAGAGARGSGSGFRRTGAIVMFLQTTTAAALLGSVLVVMQMAALAGRVDLGFNPDRLIIAELDLDPLDLDDAAGIALLERIRAALRAVPQVEALSVGDTAPLAVIGRGSLLSIDPRPRRATQIYTRYVDANFFEVLGARVRRGTPQPAPDDRAPLVVNTAYASLIERNQQQDPAWRKTVVGTVIADVRYGSLFGDVAPESYELLEGRYDPRAKVFVRAKPGAIGTEPALREALGRVSLDLRHTVIRPIEANRAVADWLPRSLTRIVGLLTLVALAVSLAGTCAVVAFVGRARRREFAIRAALGLSRSGLHHLSMTGAVWPIGFGCLAGLALAWRGYPMIEALVGAAIAPAAPVVAGVVVCGTGGLLAAWLAGAGARRVDLAGLLKTD